MTRVDVEEDPKSEKDLKELESFGFKRELLNSRRHTKEVIQALDTNGIEIVKRFALNYCAVAKRRGIALIPKIKVLDKEAIIEALHLHSSRPVYLYWRNPAI